MGKALSSLSDEIKKDERVTVKIEVDVSSEFGAALTKIRDGLADKIGRKDKSKVVGVWMESNLSKAVFELAKEMESIQVAYNASGKGAAQEARVNKKVVKEEEGSE